MKSKADDSIASLSAPMRSFPATVALLDGRTLRAAALALLFFSVTVDHYTVDVAGASIKAEHIVALGLFALLLVFSARRHTSGENLPTWNDALRWPLLWLVPYFGVTLLSSFINAPDPGTSLRHTAMITLVAASAVIVYWLADTIDMALLCARMLVVFGLLEAAYTFVVLTAANFGITIGTQPGNGNIIVPYGSLWEPNLLGSYLAAAGVLLLSFLFAAADRRRLISFSIALFVIMVALALSLARASWIGFLMGGAVVTFLYYVVSKRGVLPWRINWASVRAAVGLTLLGTLAFLIFVGPLFFPTTMQGILVRINPQWYDPSKDPALIERATATRGALDNITSHPIIGNGAGSYGETHTDTTGNPGWVSNLELHILYDSGVVGLLVFIIGLSVLVWLALKALFRAGDYPEAVRLRPEIIGLLGALAVLFVAFQATEGTWMAYFWVYVGLLASIARLTTSDQ